MPRSRLSNENRVTIKDVAQAAGVSVSTVSNFLNHRLYAMTEETRQRIEDTIRALDFHPNQVAISLVTNRTATIGLILSEIETPLFLQATSYIEPIARAAGYSILFGNARSPEDEERLVQLLLEKKVDGIIFLSISAYIENDFLGNLSPSTPPIVLVNRATNFKRYDQINWDNKSGVVEAVDYLVSLGHRRIAHLQGPLNRQSTFERLEGYRQGLEKNQIPYNDAYVQSGDYTGSVEGWRQSTEQLLSLPVPPTAILAADDTVAASAMRTVFRAGLRVPEDISVIGIDDLPNFCEHQNPPLTTVQLPMMEASKRAIQMLLEHLTGQRKKAKRVMIPCPLVMRESCGPVRKE